MNFQPRRRLGIFLMVVSVFFLIAALYTLFFYATKTIYVGGPLPERPRSQLIQHLERSKQYPMYAGAFIPSPHMYTWPYRWLSQPLAIVGISLFLAGILVGYYDDISQIF